MEEGAGEPYENVSQIPIGIEEGSTLGFQVTPVLWYCFTYLCIASTSVINAFAQAMAARFLQARQRRLGGTLNDEVC